jgi:hypothetical protein
MLNRWMLLQVFHCRNRKFLRNEICFLATNLPDETDITSTLVSASTSKDTKDELSDILGPHFNLEPMPNINGKDVEDIFKVKSYCFYVRMFV